MSRQVIGSPAEAAALGVIQAVGKNLTELQLPDEGILVLAVQHPDGGFAGAPRGHTFVHPGDTLILYGRTSVVADLDTRPDTPKGDKAHEETVAEQEEIVLEGDDEST